MRQRMGQRAGSTPVPARGRLSRYRALYWTKGQLAVAEDKATIRRRLQPRWRRRLPTTMRGTAARPQFRQLPGVAFGIWAGATSGREFDKGTAAFAEDARVSVADLSNGAGVALSEDGASTSFAGGVCGRAVRRVCDGVVRTGPSARVFLGPRSAPFRSAGGDCRDRSACGRGDGWVSVAPGSGGITRGARRTGPSVSTGPCTRVCGSGAGRSAGGNRKSRTDPGAA